MDLYLCTHAAKDYLLEKNFLQISCVAFEIFFSPATFLFESTKSVLFIPTKISLFHPLNFLAEGNISLITKIFLLMGSFQFNERRQSSQ